MKESECNAGTGGVTIEQMAENIKIGRDPYTESDRGTATIMQMVSVMEKALRDIDDFSIGSSIQPVQIARDALHKLYGPHYRSRADGNGR